MIRGQAEYVKLCASSFPADEAQGAAKRRKGNNGVEITYVRYNMGYPSYDALSYADSAFLPPSHPDERLSYDGIFDTNNYKITDDFTQHLGNFG